MTRAAMVMFKASFHAHAPEPVPGADDAPPVPEQDEPKVPPIEEERGPQVPVELPGRGGAPERVHAVLLNRA